MFLGFMMFPSLSYYVSLVARLFPVIIYNLFILNNIGWFLFTFEKPKKQQENKLTATQSLVTA
jgi:hypothetical protein